MTTQEYKKEYLKGILTHRINKSGNFRGTHINNIKASKSNAYYGQVQMLINKIIRDDISDYTAYNWYLKIDKNAPVQAKIRMDRFLGEYSWWYCPICGEKFISVCENGYVHNHYTCLRRF